MVVTMGWGCLDELLSINSSLLSLNCNVKWCLSGIGPRIGAGPSYQIDGIRFDACDSVGLMRQA